MPSQTCCTDAIAVASFTATTRTQATVLALVGTTSYGMPQRTTRRTTYSCPSCTPDAVPPLMTRSSDGPYITFGRGSSEPRTRSAVGAGRRGSVTGPQRSAACPAVRSGGWTCAEALAADDAAVTSTNDDTRMKPRMALLTSGLFLGERRFELGDALLRFGEMLALLEFLHELLEPGECLGAAIVARVRLREIVVDVVAARGGLVFVEDLLEALDAAAVPALAEIEVADQEVGLAQPILRLAQLASHFRHQAARRIAVDEPLQFANRFARLRLVALRTAHLAEMGEPELVLRVIGARVGRIEREELAELVDPENQRLGSAFAEVRVAHAELGVGTKRAGGVGFDDLLEELSGRQPLLVVERLGPLVEQELVGLRSAWRHRTPRLGAAARDGDERGRHGDSTPSTEHVSRDHRVSNNH